MEGHEKSWLSSYFEKWKLIIKKVNKNLDRSIIWLVGSYKIGQEAIVWALTQSKTKSCFRDTLTLWFNLSFEICSLIIQDGCNV